MGEIVNLNRARKAKARATAKTSAEENRIRFGRTKAEKDGVRREAERADRAIDGHRLDGHRLEADQKQAWGGRTDVEASVDPSSPPQTSAPQTSASETSAPGTSAPKTSPSRDPER